MNNISNCINKYQLSIHKIEKTSNKIILYGEENNYLLKEKNTNKELYMYLETIEYPYYLPMINDESDPYELYIYKEDNIKDNLLKGKQIIEGLLYLHMKSMYEEELKENQVEEIYHKIKQELKEKEKEYEELQNYIEGFSFPRVDYYYFINNISFFYKSIWYSKSLLDKWHSLKSHKMIKTLTLHNASLNNFTISNNSYFIDWNNCYEDERIYDLVNFYKEDLLKVPMPSLLEKYNNISPLTESEQYLFYCLICIPDKIEFLNSTYQNTVSIKHILDKMYKTFSYLSEKDKEDQKTNEEELKQQNNDINLSSNK